MVRLAYPPDPRAFVSFLWLSQDRLLVDLSEVVFLMDGSASCRKACERGIREKAPGNHFRASGHSAGAHAVMMAMLASAADVTNPME